MAIDVRKMAGRSRSIIAGTLAAWKASAFQLTREKAQKMRRQKGAKHAHATIRASGRVPGEEARRAYLANVRRRHEAREKEKVTGASARVSFADL